MVKKSVRNKKVKIQSSIKVSFLFLEMPAFGLFQLGFYKTCKSAVHVNTGKNFPISI